MKRNKGFTLLELLVVIGIIAMILGIAVTSYSAAQQRSRDGRRKADLKSMQDALEQYYSGNNFQYPVGACDQASSYLNSAWPVDPGVTPYTGDDTCTATSYCICATLETTGTGNSNDESCGNWISNGNYYCVANLQ